VVVVASVNAEVPQGGQEHLDKVLPVGPVEAMLADGTLELAVAEVEPRSLDLGVLVGVATAVQASVSLENLATLLAKMALLAAVAAVTTALICKG
jgi:hypothetical protein